MQSTEGLLGEECSELREEVLGFLQNVSNDLIIGNLPLGFRSIFTLHQSCSLAYLSFLSVSLL